MPRNTIFGILQMKMKKRFRRISENSEKRKASFRTAMRNFETREKKTKLICAFFALKNWKNLNKQNNTKEIYAPNVNLIRGARILGRTPKYPTGIMVGNEYYPNKTIIIHDHALEKTPEGPKTRNERMIEKKH